MRTISRHWPSSAPRGDFQAQCSYCGGVYRRSELRRDGAGNLMCPDDDGIDAPSLDRANAEMGPVHERFDNDAKSETKVVEVAPSLAARIGGVTW